MKQKLLYAILLLLLASVGLHAQQELVINEPTTLTDVTPWQNADVRFELSSQMNYDTYDLKYVMGVLTLDAPAAPKWQLNSFILPVDCYRYDTNYDSYDYEASERVYHIGSLLNERTSVEAQQVQVRLSDTGYQEWMAFSVPFDVNVSDIQTGPGNWVIRRYDGANRAAVKNGQTWVDVGPNEQLHAYQGYIFMRDYDGLYENENYDYDPDDCVVTLPAAATANRQNFFATGDVTVPLQHYAAEMSHNADWNFVGNPYPCYYDLQGIAENVTVWVWDTENRQFRSFSTRQDNGFVLAPCQGFFVQAAGIDQLTFRASGRRITGNIQLPELDGEQESRKGQETGAQRAALHASQFSPQSPADPGANYFNALSGEAYFDLFEPGGFLTAALSLLGDNFTAVKSVTVVAPLGDFFMFGLFSYCERVDIGRSGGFVTLSDMSFRNMVYLREVVLPDCVQSISDNAFSFCQAMEQIDCYATTPPTVTDAMFSNMNNSNSSQLIVRVPAASVAAYKAAPGWKNHTILPLTGGDEQLQSVTLSVRTPEGTDVAADCNIVWRSTEGNIIGVGRELTAQTVGTTVHYSVGLPASLSTAYEAVPDGQHTVAEAGNVITVSLTATGVVDLGSLDLHGSQGSLTFNYVPSSDTSQPLSTSDVLLAVTDKATGAAITDGISQDTLLVFQQTHLAEGQTVTVRATSRSGLFEPAEADATADADGNFALVLTLRERGHARMVCTRSEGVTDMVASVFDAAGSYVGRFTDNGSIITVSGLPDGHYTAIVMQQSQFFNTVATLADLQQTTLHEGTDYVRTAIELTAGTSRDYQVHVPFLNESALSHLDGSSYLNAQNTAFSLMQTGTLKAKAVFKSDYAAQVSNVQLLFDIPEGLHYQQGSLISQHGSSQLSGRRLIVPCQAGEQVKLCVAPDQSGTYTVIALVQYVMGGQQYTQPLGQAVMDVESIRLNLLSPVNTPTIYPRGYAFPHSHLTFYDGERVIGETTAKSNGSFEAEVTLIPALDDTHHYVYALLDNGSGQSFMTEAYNVTYDKDASMLQSVAMLYQSQRVTWNKIKGTVTPRYYNANPDLSPSATFVGTLDQPRPENIFDPMFVIATSDGWGYELPAVWDDGSQTYIATADFPDPNCLPTGVQFTYDYADPSPKDRTALLESSSQALVSVFNAMATAYDEKLQVVDVLEDTEDRLSFTFMLSGKDDVFMATAQIEDADQILAMREENVFMRFGDESEGFTMYAEDDDNSLKLYTVNLETNDAFSINIGYADGAAHAPRRVSFFGIVNGIGDFAKSLNPLQDVGEMRDLMNNSDDYRREMRQKQSRMKDWVFSNVAMLKASLGAVCPDGGPSLSQSLIAAFSEQINQLESDGVDFTYQEMDAVIEHYKAAQDNYGIQYIGGMVIDVAGGKIAKAAVGFKGGKVLQKVGNISQKIGGVEQITNFLEGAVADALGNAAKQKMDENFPKDWKGIKQYFDEWSEKRWAEWKDKVNALHASIVASYQCDEDELKPHIVKPKQEEKVEPVIDPSGFVYEGVPSNRVEGVTATVYYKENASAAETLWDAAEYGQENPVVTDAAGLYMWNVPQGLWQVRFEKDGYEPTQTGWLPVPPPQLDVNVPMMQHAAPEVVRAEAYTDGVSISFSKYMKPATLSALKVRQDGVVVSGTLEQVDAEAGLVRRVRFVPAVPFTAQEVELTVPAAAQSYAGDALGFDDVRTLPVQQVIEELLVQDDAVLALGQEGYVQVTALPAAAVAGQPLSVTIGTPLVELADGDLTFDSNGQVLVPLRGLLPGAADVTFAVGDLEARATVQVKYSLVDAVAPPVATLLTGSSVPKGTQVELLCATAGADIYYTTDGSCPCNEAGRLRYTGPITITEDVTIQAIAVLDGLADSEVQTFVYTIDEGTSIGAVEQAFEVLSHEYYDLSGQRVTPPLRRGVYIHVRRTTAGLLTRKVLVK